jgi:hypothetical protein
MIQVIARMLGWKGEATADPIDNIVSALPPGLSGANDIGMPVMLTEDDMAEKNRALAVEIMRRGAAIRPGEAGP